MVEVWELQCVHKTTSSEQAWQVFTANLWVAVSFAREQKNLFMVVDMTLGIPQFRRRCSGCVIWIWVSEIGLHTMVFIRDAASCLTYLGTHGMASCLQKLKAYTQDTLTYCCHQTTASFVVQWRWTNKGIWNQAQNPISRTHKVSSHTKYYHKHLQYVC